ncbi:hypothetical protein KUTeg_024555 [Tegillarca granosa]|uniref:Protein phosphatase methylesterase 1 n=1 Tax=Tegillarca granosa TaxID=220873 RepID=A0ABQ9DXL6_TEGGR|nr:hypothetical protein KUTeg_024555 [Tegillarca granosa]
MSALQRDALKRLGGLPPMPPHGLGSGAGGKHQFMKKRDYTPEHWDKYFQHMHDVKVGQDTFRVYESGTEGPVLLFLHGGGFSALSWACVSSIISTLVTCRCAAVDLRGHGDTHTVDETDLSAEMMSNDVGNVVKELYGDDPPPIILIGHSMGGAIAVHTAQRNLIPSLIGLVVIDVVEGTAMDALSSMQSFLRGRPTHFRSIEGAIEWSVRSGQIRNLESAKVSMVGQVKWQKSFYHSFSSIDTNETATSELEHEATSHTPHTIVPPGVGGTIAEEDEEEEESEGGGVSSGSDSKPPTKITNTDIINKNTTQQTLTSHEYTWRIDLSKTEPFWKGWFQGVDRLDKDLTIGQMQGKFWMQVLPQCGHAVHEDVPDKVADSLATYMVRNKVAQPTANFKQLVPL